MNFHIFILALCVLTSPMLQAYGNGSGFTETNRVTVDIGTPHAQPVIACNQLLDLSGFDISIISAEIIAENSGIPQHCLVYGVIAPEIQFVAQFPTHWNGRLYVHGNGGDGGQSVQGDFGRDVRNAAVRNGFVATFSNTGHDSKTWPGTTWAHNSLQREIDYSFRALHLNTVAVKRLSEAYYGSNTMYSYFDGCSTGGGQAFKEAQRFPGDFDGILAGAPVSDPFTLLLYIWNNQNAQELMQLDEARVRFLGEILMDKYDAVDGVNDGVIGNPEAIDFKPGRDLPRDPGGKNGFTDREIEGLTMAYGGLFHDGLQLAPGIPIGGERAGLAYAENSFSEEAPASAWVNRVIPGTSGSIIMRFVMQDWFRYLLLDQDDPELDWRTMDLADVLQKMEAKKPLLAATDPDLSRFKARGGKLLIYNGWADVGVNPYLVLNYYKQIRQVFGAETEDFARLFLVPGMFHCWGGINVDRFDAMTSLINWVETGKAPDSIPASRIENGQVTRTRPLCPYPQVARYAGNGDVNRAENFRCGNP